MKPPVELKKLQISYKTRKGLLPVVKGVSFSLKGNETLGLIGGSGCGKTTLCKAITGLLGNEAEVKGILEKKRDTVFAFIFQDPYLSLDPSFTIGKQIQEAVLIQMKRDDFHGTKKEIEAQAKKRAIELLGLVGIRDAEERYNHIPLNFSGGMRQRAAIAIALAMNPDVIIADELTSSLDEENKLQIIKLLDDIKNETGVSVIIVTHDLGLVKNHCDRVLIMKDGVIAEQGDSKKIFSDPRDQYTKRLLSYSRYSESSEHTHGDLHFHDGKPHSHKHDDINKKAVHGHDEVIADIKKDDRLGHVPHIIEIKNLSKSYKSKGHYIVDVLKDVTFNIHKGELLGLSGKSGVGKTTLAKCIVGLEKPDKGEIIFADELIDSKSRQMIFQDSKSSLNPRMTVKSLVKESLDLRKGLKQRDKHHDVLKLLHMVELDEQLLSKRPYEISGGQRQRVAIARALAMEPKFLIADEPISSLDLMTRSQIIHLIKKIQEENNLTVLLISHDLPMLMHVCDRIISL